MHKSLRLFSVDFYVDVVWFQMFNFAHFINRVAPSVHQLVNKNFDSIKMHGTTVKSAKQISVSQDRLCSMESGKD